MNRSLSHLIAAASIFASSALSCGEGSDSQATTYSSTSGSQGMGEFIPFLKSNSFVAEYPQNASLIAGPIPLLTLDGQVAYAPFFLAGFQPEGSNLQASFGIEVTAADGSANKCFVGPNQGNYANATQATHYPFAQPWENEYLTPQVDAYNLNTQPRVDITLSPVPQSTIGPDTMLEFQCNPDAFPSSPFQAVEQLPAKAPITIAASTLAIQYPPDAVLFSIRPPSEPAELILGGIEIKGAKTAPIINPNFSVEVTADNQGPITCYVGASPMTLSSTVNGAPSLPQTDVVDIESQPVVMATAIPGETIHLTCETAPPAMPYIHAAPSTNMSLQGAVLAAFNDTLTSVR